MSFEMKIALISPKGPLYHHRGGIFKKSLRYAPLTLTTLASLVPESMKAEIKIYDEGIEDIPDNLDVDLIGMTVITIVVSFVWGAVLAGAYYLSFRDILLGKGDTEAGNAIEATVPA